MGLVALTFYASVCWEHARWEDGTHGVRPTPTPEIITLLVPEPYPVPGGGWIPFPVPYPFPIIKLVPSIEVVEVPVPVVEERQCWVPGISAVLTVGEQETEAASAGVLVCE